MIPPTRIGDYQGIQGDFLCDFSAKAPVWEWTGEEVGLACSDRPDGLRAIAALLTRRGLPSEVAQDLLMDRDKPVVAFDEHSFASMTEYDSALGLPVAFERQIVEDTCGAAIARAGMAQLRLAESAKRAHVTEFFDGGRSEPLAGEERRVLASASLLDLADPTPRPRTAEVARAAVEAVESHRYDFILVNLGGAEAAARTGDLGTTIRCIGEIDEALGLLVRAVRRAEGVLLLTSDHGQCELMGEPAAGLASAPSSSLVPLYYVNDRDGDARLASHGALSDVAPTVLQLLGIRRPGGMTGRSLLRGSAYEP